jgi:bisphosphoglycerate-independent phosphoglycerate mutase (AlkP superfamily)
MQHKHGQKVYIHAFTDGRDVDQNQEKIHSDLQITSQIPVNSLDYWKILRYGSR